MNNTLHESIRHIINKDIYANQAMIVGELLKLDDDNSLAYYAEKCLAARKAAEAARQAQIEAELEVLNLAIVKEKLKDVGTTSFLGGYFKIQNKLNQRWDQSHLSAVLKTCELPIMPFDIEYKPNAARMKVLKDTFPDIYRKLSAALTETPAKPYFTFKETP